MSSEEDRPPNRASRLRLFQYGPAWQLPSFDPKCLAVQTFLRFANIDFEVCNNHSLSTKDGLPLLKDEHQFIESSNIFTHLKSIANNWDTHLNPAQQATQTAFLSLIELKLYPALLYNWWIEADNFEQIRKVVTTGIPFPRSFYSPPIEQFFLQQNPLLSGSSNKIYKGAQDCLSAVSVLFHGPFFFGENISTIDTVIYAYLKCILSAELPDSTLKKFVEQHDSLVTFTNRIQQVLDSQNRKIPVVNVQTTENNAFQAGSLLFAFLFSLGVACYSWKHS